MNRELTWPQFVNWAFLALIAGIMGFGAKSVSELNVKMAVVVDHMATVDKKIDSHDYRIDRLENRNFRGR